VTGPEGPPDLAAWDPDGVVLERLGGGDPGPQNLRLAVDRRGARRELVRTAAEAWEVANGWTVEPDHARRRLAELRRRLGTGGDAAMGDHGR
jgi:hypothetical protein